MEEYRVVDEWIEQSEKWLKLNIPNKEWLKMREWDEVAEEIFKAAPFEISSFTDALNVADVYLDSETTNGTFRDNVAESLLRLAKPQPEPEPEPDPRALNPNWGMF